MKHVVKNAGAQLDLFRTRPLHHRIVQDEEPHLVLRQIELLDEGSGELDAKFGPVIERIVHEAVVDIFAAFNQGGAPLRLHALIEVAETENLHQHRKQHHAYSRTFVLLAEAA